MTLQNLMSWPASEPAIHQAACTMDGWGRQRQRRATPGHDRSGQ